MNKPAHLLFSFLDGDDVTFTPDSCELKIRPCANNIFQLSAQFKNFKAYLDMWHDFENRKFFRTNVCKFLSQIFLDLENNKKVDDRLIGELTLVLLHAGAAGTMKKMQKYLDHFFSYLPPFYRQVIAAMNFEIDPMEELIFHACRPDIYLWMPRKTKSQKKLLIVYLTKTNTLNMPLPFAHIILSKLGLNILYIFNKPNKPNDAFVANFSYDKTIKIIQTLCQKYGFKEIFGTGASLGGYKITQMAADLNMKRVLNFSGNIFHNKSSKVDMGAGFDCNKILSILSLNNKTDIAIAEAYKKNNFKTLVDYANIDTHGSFTASFLENKLDLYLDWLIKGEGKFEFLF